MWNCQSLLDDGGVDLDGVWLQNGKVRPSQTVIGFPGVNTDWDWLRGSALAFGHPGPKRLDEVATEELRELAVPLPAPRPPRREGTRGPSTSSRGGRSGACRVFRRDQWGGLQEAGREEDAGV